MKGRLRNLLCEAPDEHAAQALHHVAARSASHTDSLVDDDGFPQWDNLPAIFIASFAPVNTTEWIREEFLEVRLDHLRVLRLPENLQQVVVADEVKPRQHRPLLLEVLRQRLLAQVELRGHLREVLRAHARLRKRLHQ